jgi:hypothetical protein
VDVVQVGAEADAFYVRVECTDPTAVPLLQMLAGLRVRLLQRSGGGEGADFLVRCASDAGRR